MVEKIGERNPKQISIKIKEKVVVRGRDVMATVSCSEHDGRKAVRVQVSPSPLNFGE